MPNSNANIPVRHGLSDRYAVRGFLGRGGMGEVLRVYDQVLERDLACKLLLGLELKQREIDRFSTEFTITGRLDHPNIIQVYDFGFTSHGHPFYTMEIIPGDTLEKRAGTMPFQQLCGAVFDVCLALDRMHSAGLIHNDIKARNVMVIYEDGNPKRTVLMDLGLVCTGTTQTGHFKGTIGYVAPEIIRGESYDHRADIYSLGVLLYRCLAGRLPFDAGSVHAILASQVMGRIVPLNSLRPDLSPEIVDIVSRCMALDPLRRYPSAADLIGDLAAIPATGVADRTAQLAPSYGLPQDFIGRNTALKTLNDTLMRTLKGSTSICAVTGSRGIGKSRLLHEFKMALQVKGCRFTAVRTLHAGTEPLHPVRQAIRAALRESGEIRDAVARESAYALYSLLPDEFPETPEPESIRFMDPENRRHWFLLDLARVYRRLSAGTPAVLFMDDFHHSDKNTVEWVVNLLDQTAGRQPLLVVLAASEPDWRSLAAFPPYDRVMERISASAQIQLEPLRPVDVESFLSRRFGEAGVTPELARRLHDETGGNPLFLEALSLEMVDRKLIRRIHFRWRIMIRSLDELPVAAGVRDVFKRRLLALNARDRHLLNLLSIFPVPVEFDTIRSIHGGGMPVILESLRRLVTWEYVAVERRGTRISTRFLQNQVRTMVSEMIPGAQARQWHLQAAEILSLQATAMNAVLAHHYSQGGDLDNAVKCAFKAGKDALKIYAFEEGAHHLELALAHLKKMGHPLQSGKPKWSTAVMDRLAECYTHAGRTDRAESVVRSQLKLARKHGSPEDEIPILSNLGLLKCSLGQKTVGYTYYRKAMDRMTRVAHPTPYQKNVSAGITLNMASLLMEQGQVNRSEEMVRAGYRASRDTGNAYLQTLFLTLIAMNRYHAGKLSMNLLDRSMELAEQHGYRDAAIQAGVERAVASMNAGRIGDAVQQFEELQANADRQGAVQLKARTRYSAMRAMILAGRLNRAAEINETLRIYVDHPGLKQFEDRIHHAAGLFESAMGRTGSAVTLFLSALEFAGKNRSRLVELLVSMDLIGTLLNAGRLDDARSRVQMCQRLCRRLSLDSKLNELTYYETRVALLTGNIAVPPRRPGGLAPLLRMEWDAMILDSRCRRQGYTQSLHHRWERLIAAANAMGAILPAMEYRFMQIRQILDTGGSADSPWTQDIPEHLNRIKTLCRDNGMTAQSTRADRMLLLYGERMGDPETLYTAQRNLQNPVPETLAQDGVSSAPSTTRSIPPADPVTAPLAQPAVSGLSEKTRHLLQNDRAGQQLLKLLQRLNDIISVSSGEQEAGES